jgi:hypothetical protein
MASKRKTRSDKGHKRAVPKALRSWAEAAKKGRVRRDARGRIVGRK